MSETLRIPDAPESALPPLLAAPPWTAPRSTGPIVLKLKTSKAPTTMQWAPGMREMWLKPEEGDFGAEPLPDDTDWGALAEKFASGEALEMDPPDRYRSFIALVMQAPPDLGEKLLADERHWDVYERHYAGFSRREYRSSSWTGQQDQCSERLSQGAAARHGVAALPFLLHRAKDERLQDRDNTRRPFYGLTPYLDSKVVQLMVKNFDAFPNHRQAMAWYRNHGLDAARLTVPIALRKPGPTRERAEHALRMVADEHGLDSVAEAARHYGDEAATAMSALYTEPDPMDDYPDQLPEIPEAFAPENLPRLLLRGREQALPPAATRNFVTMLLLSRHTPPYRSPGPFMQVLPYAAVPQAAEALDPRSLAEFAWALYLADRHPKLWASPAAQYALLEFGDDETADRFAPIVKRWSKSYVWDNSGVNALRLFTRLKTDSALRHLHMLSQKADDPKRIRPAAEGALEMIAEERGLTPEQLADRLVPDLGLDCEGGMTLDYGRRTFRVGFDEHLKPHVTDEAGKVRKTLPKPGVKDDDTLAPAAHQRFADLKKEARTVAADQIKRLEQAMVAGRSWTPEEFRSIFAEHPLLRHIARRLVWTAGTEAFRVAEDGTLADAGDDAFTLPDDTRVTLPHPLRHDLAPWAEVFADYEILQPFEQLARPVHTLTDEERAATELARFDDRTAHFGRVLGLTSRGWEMGDVEDGGFRRQVMLMTSDGRHVMVWLDPGIRVIAPEDYAEQRIRRVTLHADRYGKAFPLGELDPVAASEVIAALTRLTT